MGQGSSLGSADPKFTSGWEASNGGVPHAQDHYPVWSRKPIRRQQRWGRGCSTQRWKQASLTYN